MELSIQLNQFISEIPKDIKECLLKYDMATMEEAVKAIARVESMLAIKAKRTV